MELRLLGPVEIRFDGRELDAGPPRQRLVLAVLAAEAGRAVSLESLVDRVWDEAPEKPRRTLQVYISKIRKVLKASVACGQPPVRVVRGPGGYVLAIEPDRVDIQRFRRLVAQARDPKIATEERADQLREAIALWQGEPLSGLRGGWVSRTREVWLQEKLDAVALWTRVEHRCGNAAAVIGALTDLVGQHPFAENLTADLMRVLHFVGRTADALKVYTRARQLLADELGIDPGHDLQQLHQAILRGDTCPLLEPQDKTSGENGDLAASCTLEAVDPSADAGCGLPSRPRQLPRNATWFTGRSVELQRLLAVASGSPPGSAGSTVAISAIDGMAGIGKTALAVRAAHRVANDYPDGQLFINLYGHTRSVDPIEPAEALDRMLRALGVTGPHIPVGLEERAALYRTCLADRRMVIVLDNAADVDQVAPLLPGAPGNLVLITSRHRLVGLDPDHVGSGHRRSPAGPCTAGTAG